MRGVKDSAATLGQTQKEISAFFHTLPEDTQDYWKTLTEQWKAMRGTIHGKDFVKQSNKQHKANEKKAAIKAAAQSAEQMGEKGESLDDSPLDTVFADMLAQAMNEDTQASCDSSMPRCMGSDDTSVTVDFDMGPISSVPLPFVDMSFFTTDFATDANMDTNVAEHDFGMSGCIMENIEDTSNTGSFDLGELAFGQGEEGPSALDSWEIECVQSNLGAWRIQLTVAQCILRRVSKVTYTGGFPRSPGIRGPIQHPI